MLGYRSVSEDVLALKPTSKTRRFLYIGYADTETPNVVKEVYI